MQNLEDLKSFGMGKKLKGKIYFQHWPLIITLFIYSSIIFFLWIACMEKNNGIYTYPLDDTYIHMSIAKNFSLYGTWGITKYEFTSTTSSLTWPFLLSLNYDIFGVNDKSPFILNFIFSIVTIFVVYSILLNNFFSKKYILSALLVFMLVTPLPALTFLGMEHILHLLLTIVFVFLAISILESEKSNLLKVLSLILISSLLSATRYEGGFTILAVSILFLLKKRIKEVLLIGFAAILPLLVYGFISLYKGWWFLPNSVVLKASASFFEKFHAWNSTVPILLILIYGLLVYFYRFKKFGFFEKTQTLLFILLTNIILQLLLASLNWFFRYEAYLIGLGIVIFSFIIKEFNFHVTRTLAGTLILFLPFIPRALMSLEKTPRACNDIYQQQYQMSQFIHKYYSGRGACIVLNDIGATTFYNDIRCLDMGGLGSKEIASGIIKNTYTTELIDYLAKRENALVAMIYDHWFVGDRHAPNQWIRLGQWITPATVIAGSDTVSIYATNPDEKTNLLNNLKDFEKRLPDTVKQKGLYVKNNDH